MKLAELKAIKAAPEWMTEEGLSTLSKGYLLPRETPLEMYTRLANAAASQYDDAGLWGRKFFNAMWKNWLCPASPVASNLGTDRGLPISCNSISVADSLTGIFAKVHELAMLTKYGAGVGVYLGRIRGRGEDIKGNGRSEGVVPWSKIYDTTIASCNQGSTRRGAAALYLPIEHLDIEEFINIRRPVGDVNRRCLNINHGICISNSWMTEMLAGDEKKRALWREILKARIESGEPYLFFQDNANQQNPACYKDKDLLVETSNICCLSGDTLVWAKLSKNAAPGHYPISSLVDKSVWLFDGVTWVENDTISQRGVDSLLRVHFGSGAGYVDCNPSHRWFLETRNNPMVLAKDLKPGMRLEHFGACGGSNLPWTHEVVYVEPLPGTHPVYCPSLPTTGKFGLANGLMTGNTEITLHTDPDHSFVCCLSSLNLARYDEWKDTDVVNTAVRFLDAVISEYITKSEGLPGLECSRRSAIKGRAIGVGVLGWHTLLQERGVPFDSFDAMQLNAEIFRTMREKAEQETAKLAAELGEPEWCQGHNRRNTHLLAIAPTVSNSLISGGHSAGIEPLPANIYEQKSAKGTFIRRNPSLEKLLKEKGKDTPEVWADLTAHAGSVQHVNFLSDHEKEVFLTALEINQYAIIKQAAQRQRWIDQGQSVNLFFSSNASGKYIHDVHVAAWESGLKSLYYMRTTGVLKGDMASRSKDECAACEA